MGRKAPRKRLACRVMACPTGVPPSTQTSLGAPPTPRFGVSEATMQSPGRRHAPRERDGLFDIVRRSASAVHFGETNPTNPTRVVSALRPRPLHWRGPGRRPFIRTKHQPAAVGKDRRLGFPVSGLLFTMDYAT